MIDCSHCGYEVLKRETPEGFSPDTLSLATECPQCGHPQNLNFVQDYLITVRDILISPTRFFSTLSASGDLGRPLAFALITHWVGASMGFLWGLVTGQGAGEKWIRKLFLSNPFSRSDALNSSSYSFLPLKDAQDHFFGWYYGLGSVLLDPFTTLVSILTSSLVIFIGARILVSPPRSGPANSQKTNEIRYESALRVVSYGLTPSLLITIPFIGNGVASIYVLVVTIIGVKEMFRVPPLRATIIALFPKLCIFVIIGLGAMTLIFGLFKFLSFF